MEIKAIATNAVNGLNGIGRHATDIVKGAGKYLDGAVVTIKDSTKDSFVANKLKDCNVGKETFIGAAILTAGVILAVKCVKGINKTIQNFRKDAG